MHIGLVLSKPPGYSETFFNSKIRGLQAHGHKVTLFTGPSKTRYQLCAHKRSSSVNRFLLVQLFFMCMVVFALLPHLSAVLRFIKLEKNEGTPRKRILKKIYLNAHLLKFKGDWLHFGFGTLAIDKELIAEAIGVQLAVSFRGFDIGVYPLKHPGCYAKLWDKVSKIHVISNGIADLVYTHGFQDQAPIVKITPAIDVQHFSASQSSTLKTPVQLVTVARLHWIKGLTSTLEALAHLNKLGVAFDYTLIGTGPEKEALKFACHQLGLEDQVHFLGTLNPDEVKQQLASSDVYIQYSLQEGFCNAVLEAQAMGLLCVVSDAEGLSENVKDNYSGWVVPKRQPKLLAQKLFEVMALPAEAKLKISKQAIQRVRDDFTLEAQNEAFQDFYLKNI